MKLKIKKTLHEKLKNHTSRASKVYLLGENEDGVISAAVLLKHNDHRGCTFMRGVDSKVMHAAYAKLLKKKCTPAAMANLLDYRRMAYGAPTLRGWAGVFGNALRRFSGFPFIIYDKHVIIGVVASKKGRRMKVELEIV